MRHLIIAGLVGVMSAANGMQADTIDLATEEELRARVLELGAHDHPKQINAVELNNCVLTTYVYRPFDDHGMVLWSSFRWELPNIKFTIFDKAANTYSMFAPLSDVNGMSFLVFNALDGYEIRHEMAYRRSPKPPYEPSPRQTEDAYVYKMETGGFMHYDDVPDASKLDGFARTVIEYGERFCFMNS